MTHISRNTSTVAMSKDKLIEFIVVYCSASHIPHEDKKEEVAKALDQVFALGLAQGKEEGGNCG